MNRGVPGILASGGALPLAVLNETFVVTGSDVVNFGVAAAGRLIVLLLPFTSGNSNGPGTATVTIGGVAATVFRASTGTHGNCNAYIAYAVVPTGTSGTVTISTTNSLLGLPLGAKTAAVFSLYNLISSIPTGTWGFVDDGDFIADVSVSGILPDSITLCAAVFDLAGSFDEIVWTGATKIGNDFESSDTDNRKSSIATGTVTSGTISAQPDVNPGAKDLSLAVASWR